MSKKRRVIETLKTCLIVLLAVSAVFLAARTRLFDAFFSSVSFSGLLQSGEKSSSAAPGHFEAAAFPANVVVTNSGGRCAGDRDALYAGCAPLLGEALGSSKEPARVGNADWRQALAGDSMYFSYAEPVRLSVLAGWFSTEVSHKGADSFVRRLCVSAGEESPELYYIDESDGSIYRCATAASLQSFLSLTAAFLPDEARFAYELPDRFAALDPYMLIPSGAYSLPLLEGQDPIGTSVNENNLLSCFGMNTYISARYTEQSGDTVYVEGETTLRADADGFVAFRQSSEGSRLPVQAGEAQAIEAARQLLSNVEQAVGGAGRFTLHSCEKTESGYLLRFGLCVNGMPVFLPEDRPAAEITVAHGCISQAGVCFRAYNLSQESVTLLPARQAAAVAEAKGYREAVPGWRDNLGGAPLSPEWLLKGGV